jgi:hypothetical protein
MLNKKFVQFHQYEYNKILEVTEACYQEYDRNAPANQDIQFDLINIINRNIHLLLIVKMNPSKYTPAMQEYE